MERDKTAMTYAQLKRHLDKLTPEQLAHKVMWCSEARGAHLPAPDAVPMLTVPDDERTAEAILSVVRSRRYLHESSTDITQAIMSALRALSVGGGK